MTGGLIMLDETVVGVALPTMRRDLGLSELTSHWVINAYMLLFTACAVAGGKFGDMVGVGRVFLLGMAVFGLASLAAGFAGNGATLVAVRAVQGLGAAAIFPATIALVMAVFPTEERGKALGILAAIATSFLALGPLIGGLFTEAVSWRWIFWVNVPVVLLASLVMVMVWAEPPRQDKHPRFDVAGLITLVASLSLLVFGTMQGSDWGWSDPLVVASLVCGLVVLGAFVRIEARRDLPLIEVSLFKIASFSACNAMLFAGQFSKLAIVVFGALYLQHKLGMGPLVAGLALLAAVAPFPILSAPVGRLADNWGARPLVMIGLTLATCAMFALALVIPWNSYLWLLPGLVLWGCGLSLCYSPILRAMANTVPEDMQGQCSGIGITSRLLGGTVGVAIGSVLLAITADYQYVFLLTAGVMLASLLFGWLALDRKTSTRDS
ncbi:MAG: MFS transporter [Kiloniellales bacterium]|nr:MFS transporter [Kiloniellales bacterium]